MLDKQNLAKLSVALYENKNFTYNDISGEDAMRNIMFDALGVEPGTTGMALKRAYDINKSKMFEVIDVAVDALLPKLVKNEFDGLANFINTNIGDVPRFQNKNTELFRVARIASGTQDIRRQTGLASSYTIPTEWYGAATYVEFEQFLTGQVNWTEFVQRIAESFSNFIGERIYTSFAESYDAVRTELKSTGTFDLDTLLGLVRKVKAVAGGKEVSVYGSPAALAKIVKDLDMSSNMRDEFNKLGLLSVVQGMKLMALPEAYKAGTNEFLVSDDALVIIPSGEKIVDVVMEGQTYTYETASADNSGLQMDFKTTKKLGIQVRQAAVYGFYKLT